VAARRGKEGQSQRATAQQDTQLATLLKASQAAQLRGVLEHARELARVQTEAASAQAANARLRGAAIKHARELAQLRGELRSRDAEIAELKRARMHASAADAGDAGGGGGAGADGGSGGASGGGSASGQQQVHTSHQALHLVKQEKADVGAQLVDKDEL
jgi:hypothetical protein